MCWSNPQAASPAPLQQELFPDLTAEEQLIVSTLEKVDDKQINQIVVETGMPFSRVSSLMFELELKGMVRVLGGARYKLIRR
jgi:DNA processing protein